MILSKPQNLFRLKAGHLKDSKDFYDYLFPRIPKEHLVAIQQNIIDCTRGDHWNDLSHNTKNVIIEYISQNPNDSLSILLSRLSHIKNYTALHKMADIYHQVERGIFKPGVTKMNGHIITQEMADKCKQVFELQKQNKMKEAAKLIKKYSKEKWLSSAGKNLNKNAVKPVVGNPAKALKKIWEPKVALRNMHKAGKAGAAVQAVVSISKQGYQVFKGEDINVVDVSTELIKDTSKAYVSAAVGAQIAASAGILLFALTPAGWVVVPGTIIAGIGAGVATNKGCDLIWDKIEGTSTFKNYKELLSSKLPIIKGFKRRKLERSMELSEIYSQINHNDDKYTKFIKLEAAFHKKYGHPWHSCLAA